MVLLAAGFGPGAKSFGASPATLFGSDVLRKDRQAFLIEPRAHGVAASVVEKSHPVKYALRQAERALDAVGNGWPDLTKDGRPRPTLRNTMIAMLRLGVEFAFDMFRYRKTAQGFRFQQVPGRH